MNLPSEVPDLRFSEIVKRTEAREALAMNDPIVWKALAAERQTQEYFLNNFRKTFNISLSLALVSANYATFRKWQSDDMHFVTQYNDIHAEWKARIMASAASRAVGYLAPCDQKNPTTSGYVEDATGSPIYEGADSRLSLRFLEALHPETFGQKTELNVNGGAPLRDITPDDTGQDAADIYSQMVKEQKE